MSQNLGRLQPHYNVLEYWDTSKTFNLSLETNGKLMALGVPILKHFRVCSLNFLPVFRTFARAVHEHTVVLLNIIKV